MFRSPENRAANELNPYVTRPAILSQYVIAETAKPQVNHDHPVSEGGLEPLAYVLAATGDLWLRL
jgi:hypothetical protein